MASKLRLLCRLCSNPIQKRGFSSDKPWPPPALKAKFESYQREDGIPVYLKGGFGDKALFQATLGLCIIGSLLGYASMLTMAFPKKA